MAWKSFMASAAADRTELLEELLWDWGALSVTLEDAGDEPLYEPAPEETPLWQQNQVTGLFDENTDIEGLKLKLEQSGFQQIVVSDLEDRPWEREWLERFKPMQFGKRLWICPSGYDLAEEGKVVVHLDPGLAFGTGTHPTTSLCLSWLDAMDLGGKSLMDYGCGSGILAIAGALLGCENVIGTDNDPQAILASKENSKKNQVEAKIRFGLSNSTSNKTVAGKPVIQQERIKVDYLIANILAKPLIELKDVFLSFLNKGSSLAMSGIMADQKDWVIGAYEDQIRFDPPQELDGWILLTGKRI